MTDEHSYEDALEPRHLIRRSDVVLRAGILMLGAGTSGLRVREVMRAVAGTVGLRRIRALVTYTEIVLTIRRRATFRTQVAEIGCPGVNAHRIAMLQRFAAELPPRTSVAEVDARLDAIESTPRLYPGWLLVVMVALACAGVTVLTGGGPREVACVLPASALAYALHRFMGSRQLNHLAAVMTSAVVATGLFVGFSRLLDLALSGSSPRFAAGFICAAIFLIPGFPLVTAGLDLARIDLGAGLPRLVYAALALLAITLGVWVVAAAANVSPDPVPPSSGVWFWIAATLASFLAVAGWAMMFNCPLPEAAAAGVIAVLGNLPRLLMIQSGVKAHVATFVACFAIGLLCALAGRLFGLTKIIMTVPTLLVSIPGSSALRTLIYFDRSDVLQAMENGVATVMVVIAMIAGLAGARMLTDPEWAFTRGEPQEAPWRLLRRLLPKRRPAS